MIIPHFIVDIVDYFVLFFNYVVCRFGPVSPRSCQIHIHSATGEDRLRWLVTVLCLNTSQRPLLQ